VLHLQEHQHLLTRLHVCQDVEHLNPVVQRVPTATSDKRKWVRHR